MPVSFARQVTIAKKRRRPFNIKKVLEANDYIQNHPPKQKNNNAYIILNLIFSSPKIASHETNRRRSNLNYHQELKNDKLNFYLANCEYVGKVGFSISRIFGKI